MAIACKNIITALIVILLPCFVLGQSLRDTAAERLLLLLRSAGSDTAIISLDIQFGKYYIDKPGEDPADIQKALYYAEDASRRCKQARLALRDGQCETLFAQIYREKGDMRTAFVHAQKALKILAPFTLSDQLADADFEMANYYGTHSTASVLDRKIDHYSKGVAIIKILYPNSYRLADAQKFLGDLLNINYRLKEALTELDQALAIYKQLHYSELQDIYSIFASVWTNLGYPKQALKYALLALQTSEAFKDSSMTVCALHFRLGNIYSSLNSFDLAISAFQKAKYYAEVNKDTFDSQIIPCSIALAYNRNKQPDKALLVVGPLLKKNPTENEWPIQVYLLSDKIDADIILKDYPSALSSYSEMQNGIWGVPTRFGLLKYAHNSAIDLLIKTHRFANLNRHLQALREVLRIMNAPGDMRESERLAFQIDSAEGNYRSALIHLQRFSSLCDTINRRNHDRDLDILQIQYNAEKMDEELAAKAREVQLLTSQSELQGKALKAGVLTRKLFFTVAALALLFIGLIINRYRYRIKSNGLLEKSQLEIHVQNTALTQLAGEREWLLKEIHHRVKNNLQIIISLLNSQMAFIEDHDALSLIKESQARMQAISLIHQRLYQSDDLSGIDMNSYIYDLCSFLKASFFSGRKIEIGVSAEMIRLDVQQAIPLGLIINEALINTLKYAFTESQEHCRSNIRLDQDGQLQTVLTISDNGAGHVPHPGTDQKDISSRYDVMRIFTGQLMGEISFFDDPAGSHLALRFMALHNKELIAS
jgi:two-component system, sensor histidine kinase PdtaS